MVASLRSDDAEVFERASDEPGYVTPLELLDERRPNMSGDLPAMLQAGPMFRRAFRGYSRFQVDTYVQWAEDELAAAARENGDVLARYADVCRELEETQQLLSHSPSGADFLRVSRRIGKRLADAGDQAEVLVAEAEAHREAAEAKAAQMLAHAAAEAQRALADGSARAEQILADASQTRAEAERVLADAQVTAENARIAADALMAQARADERQAVGEAERLLRLAADEAAALRLQAQHEGVRMLATARDERLRSDAEAAAVRARLDEEAAMRRAAVIAEVEQLERKRALLEAALRSAAEPAAVGRRAVRPGVWKRHGRRAVSRV